MESAVSGNRIVIDYPRDLGGTTMTIPEDRTLVFRGDGCIQNGVVVGNNTTVKAERKVVFKNVVLNGTFHSIVAYPEWFDAKADCILDNNNKVISGTDNINAFRNLFLFDNISISSGTYMLSGALRCLSGQTVEGCNATLKFTGKGVFMHIDGSSLEAVVNVIIRNLTIIGSKLEYTDITEHWHGVYIGYAKTIKIEDVRCELCRGDGFYIGTALSKTKNNRIPENIELDGVESYYNHRQGLSITRVRVAKVKNSEFCYTLGTMPQAGMDIEPNSITDDSGKLIVGECEDIEISNCLFKGNKREGLILSNWYCTDSSINIINNVKVTGCRFVDDDLYVSGSKDCNFSNLELVNSNISVTGKGIIQNVKFNDISIEDDNKVSTRNGIELGYTKEWAQRSNIYFENISIKGFGGAAIKASYQWPVENGLLKGVTIKNCKFENCGANVVSGEKALMMTFCHKVKNIDINYPVVFLVSMIIVIIVIVIFKKINNRKRISRVPFRAGLNKEMLI